MPPKGVVKKAFQTTRFHRPGVATGDYDRSESSSEEDSADEEEEERAPAKPQPKVSSFPSSKKLAFDLSKAGKQTTEAAKVQAQKKQEQQQQPDADLEGYVTASESDSEDEESDSDRIAGRSVDDSSEEEEDSSSDDDEPAKLVRPVFVSKNQRAKQAQSADARAAEEEARKQEQANALLEAKVQQAAAERAAGRSWDDDEEPVDNIDDRDGLDPEEEHAAWKLRELKRVRRDRMALVEKEREREEVERRRNMTAEEREAEDAAFIAAQREEQEGRGKMAHLQKYVHKGAFFQTDDRDEEMDEDVREAMQRDLAGARFEDDVLDKTALPEYMQVRDMTKIGRSGRTRYKDLKSEDTGVWGDIGGKKRDFDGVDERFRPDGYGGGSEKTGANVAPVGERRKREDTAAWQGKRQRIE